MKSNLTAGSRMGDRLLVVLTALAITALALWLWAGNGVQVFAEVISAGLALCF